MKIYKLPEYTGCNTYIVTEDGKSCVVVDPGEDPRRFLEEHSMECRAVLLTHGHLDHILFAKALTDMGAKLYMPEKEKAFIFSAENESIFGEPIDRFPVEKTLRDGEEIELCGMVFKCMETPGHTEGSCCYILGDAMFCGDTVFKMSVGRCDLPSGDEKKLFASLKRLKDLGRDYALYPGHGENTTMRREIVSNPYFLGI